MTTRWLLLAAGAWAAACATYEPALIGGAAQGGSSASGNAGSVATTHGGTGSNVTPTPNAGTAPASPGGGSPGGSSTTGGGSGGAPAGSGGVAVNEGGEAGGADAPACADCVTLKDALLHRYDFEGSGTAVTDRVGTAHGTVQGGAVLGAVGGKGAVTLGGGKTGAYVDLPNGLLSALSDATIEAWVTWGGGGPWQRIFDFGDSTSATPEDNPANGLSYLFLTPMTDENSGGTMRLVYSVNGGAPAAETRLEAGVAMPTTQTQVVVVVDSVAGKLLLYQDGGKLGEQAFAGSLSAINDVNVWLGRSQYNADAELTGTFHDFRIYGKVLTVAQIATSFTSGPDPAFLAE